MSVALPGRAGRVTAMFMAATLIGAAAQAATLIHAGRVIDGVSPTPTSNQTVVVEGGKITAIEAA